MLTVLLQTVSDDDDLDDTGQREDDLELCDCDGEEVCSALQSPP